MRTPAAIKWVTARSDSPCGDMSCPRGIKAGDRIGRPLNRSARREAEGGRLYSHFYCEECATKRAAEGHFPDALKMG